MAVAGSFHIQRTQKKVGSVDIITEFICAIKVFDVLVSLSAVLRHMAMRQSSGQTKVAFQPVSHLLTATELSLADFVEDVLGRH